MILKNFIVFEGIDGAGTTTQLNILREKYCTAQNVFFSAEPTAKETGVFLRRVLKGEIPARAETAVYLFAADRDEHIFGANGVAEHTKNGGIEISDRYFFSSLAYQGQNCGWDFVKHINAHFPLPELLFFFDISADDALKRIDARGEAKEIFEKKEFLEKTVQAYKKIIADYQNESGMKIVCIDALKSKEEIAHIIDAQIREMYFC